MSVIDDFMAWHASAQASEYNYLGVRTDTIWMGFAKHLQDTIESLKAELDIAKKFHAVAVAERNFEQARCDRLTAERDALKDEVERLRQWYADSHRIIDEWDTKCSALKAENAVMENALRINHIRIHIWKTGFHWWIVPKADWDLAKTLPVIMRETEPLEQQ